MLSPQGLTLIRLALEAGNLPADHRFRKAFADWTATFPKQINGAFAPGIKAVLALRENDLLHAIQEGTSRQEPLLDFLGKKLLAEGNPSQAKVRGAVFTPAWLVDRVTQRTLQIWRRLNRGGRRPTTVADVSCGVGAFLSAADVFGPGVRIIGVESDAKTFQYATLLRWMLKVDWELFNRDALLPPPHRSDLFEPVPVLPGDTTYDILIGNPPYIRSASLSASYVEKLRKDYECASFGSFDLSVLFIEHAMHTLSPDGVASYVLTNKFMTASYGRAICKALATKVRIIAVEDFQDCQLFPGYTTYTCVLTFAKKPPAKRFNVTRFPKGVEPGRDPGGGEESSLPSERLREHPWDFAAGTSHEALRLLRNSNNPLLLDVFRGIQQGLRTGANDIFVVPSEKTESIEEELLLPFVEAEQIQLCRIDTRRHKLLFPYRQSSDGTFEPIREVELRAKYPNAWAYLSAHRKALEERSLEDSQNWYCYSRTQNLDFSSRPKILVREMLPTAIFAADLEGRVAFCSGYGLGATGMPRDILKLWTAVLSTPTMEFSLRHQGTQLHSGWFRLMKHHLARVRLPNIGAKMSKAITLANRLFRNPEDSRTLSALDVIVAEAFGLSTEHRQLIGSLLRDWHSRSLPRSNRAVPKKPSGIGSPDADEPAKSSYEPIRLDKYNLLTVESNLKLWSLARKIQMRKTKTK